MRHKSKVLNRESLLLFAKTISGHFSNLEQSQKNPKDFAHINIYFRPLERSILNGPWFYSEQSYDFAPWSPYRQALHKIIESNGLFLVENYCVPISTRIAGAGFLPELLIELQTKNPIMRKGCTMKFKEVKPGKYSGNVETGQKCLISHSRKKTYLVSNVEVNSKEWISLDEGYEINTHKKIWGSKNGPLRFKKINSFGNHINLKWFRIT